ncbi:MAG: translation elongation factor Ts [Alphaproteobacteria bacterium]|nr:translation elongation factor Ts [Alphaproteobacteria bacterium]
MADITAALVKQLRDKSGAGMMDCKTALTESNGDVEAAVDWLRTKGLAAASKKAGRVAAEGLVACAVSGGKGVVVEVNSETDFVARNEDFQEFVGGVAEVALSVDGDVDRLKTADFPGAGKAVAEKLTDMVSTIGENLNLRRSQGIEVKDGVVAHYVHSAIVPGLGKIGVLVALESAGDKDKLTTLGKQIAMHVAATNPLAITTDNLDPADIERERAVLTEQARETGRPDDIIAKMVEGRLRKFFEEVVLAEQVFVIDGETKIGKVIEAAAEDVGAPVAITGFIRFALGDGVEREEKDFAAEVAQQLGN